MSSASGQQPLGAILRNRSSKTNLPNNTAKQYTYDPIYQLTQVLQGATTAALDRLLHRSTVINIRGDSYRLKEKRQAKASSAQEVTMQT